MPSGEGLPAILAAQLRLPVGGPNAAYAHAFNAAVDAAAADGEVVALLRTACVRGALQQQFVQ